MVYKIINKIIRLIRTLRIKEKYKISHEINIKGKVQLDNPNIKFGNNVTIYSGVHIWGTGSITIGNNVAIGRDTVIFANQPMIIGNDTSIAGQCYIIDSNHGIKESMLIREQPLESESITIGNDVWIGAGTKILKGAQISDGSVVGAMSLVNKYIEPYSVNVGVPVKKIKYRSD